MHKTCSKRTFFIIQITIVVFFVLYFFVFDWCIIKKIFGIDCPTCGITRAWICFFNGEIEKAFNFHPFFLFLPFTIISLVFLDMISKKSKIIGTIIIIFDAIMVTLTLIRYFMIICF